RTGGRATLRRRGPGGRRGVVRPAAAAGLAPWLAASGYAASVPDLRDRVTQDSPLPDISQTQLICEDLPALFQLVAGEHPAQRFAVIAHGWGGVLLASALCREPAWLDHIARTVLIGARRVCAQRNWQRW